jgi:hypothetical protein
MGIVATFDRKDYATKEDIDNRHSMLVHMASKADMAQGIDQLIKAYPDLAAILLLAQIGRMGREDQDEKPEPKTKKPDDFIQSLLGKLGQKEGGTAKVRVVEIDADEMGEDADKLLELLKRMSKRAA